MSSTNYDVELNISYNYSYRHYIPTYKIACPYYSYKTWMPSTPGLNPDSTAYYNAFISFDSEGEQELGYLWRVYSYGATPPVPCWSNGANVSPLQSKTNLINATGVFSKIYFRNPNRDRATFTASNCYVGVEYTNKAAFEVKWNATGFAANQNPVFKCSTVQKNTYGQYVWSSATVYYKKSSASSYSSAAGSVSGSWSDVTISTGITLQDGYTYNVYIRAVADDGTVATTPVANFNTVDTTAVATCLSPVGAFTQGDVTFIWSHATSYGTPQHAYDLQYTSDNGSTWITVSNHVLTTNNTVSITLNDAGVYKWRVRTYNSNDIAGEWAEASFVNNVPANPPTNLSVTTAGRPTVTWASVSQSAYQVQLLLNEDVVYDSGAVYTSQTSHFVNQYFNDERAYNVRCRVYNALGEVSEWAETGYQQPSVNDVSFEISQLEGGGAQITVTPADVFTKYFLLRDDRLIAKIKDNSYSDYYAVGLTNYSVVAVTSGDQSDIQTSGFRVAYPHATVVALNGQQLLVNKRVDSAYEVQTSNEADINKVSFFGDGFPTHYPSDMRLKSFTITCFDDQGIAEGLLGNVVFYADNFGNGGYCMVTNYSKTDNFVKNGAGVYANEVSLTLEVTNYDDSIEYPI